MKRWDSTSRRMTKQLFKQGLRGAPGVCLSLEDGSYLASYAADPSPGKILET